MVITQNYNVMRSFSIQKNSVQSGVQARYKFNSKKNGAVGDSKTYNRTLGESLGNSGVLKNLWKTLGEGQGNSDF